jgi:uncharacterized membrane protein
LSTVNRLQVNKINKIIRRRKGEIVKNDDLKKMRIQTPVTKRFIEIDMLRGLALILMIFGHILWDLDYFGIASINNGLYSSLQKIVPPLFFLLVGLSLIVTKKKIEDKPIEDQNKYYLHLILRGLKIFSLGMIITIGTLIFIPEKVVLFGVLHCIGLSIVISAPFLKYRNYNLLFATIILFFGTIFAHYHIASPTFAHLMLGIHQVDLWRYTLDYFPMIPWFGFILLGIVVGDWLYSGDERRFKMPDLSKYRPVKIFEWFGRHSLVIYLLHQPIIAGAITLFNFL